MHFAYSPSPPSTSYTTRPMDIPTSNGMAPSRPVSPCAYPCWPRRASLSSPTSSPSSTSRSSRVEDVPLATSYISDDDLFPSTFDEMASASESDDSPAHSLVADAGPAHWRQELRERRVDVVDPAKLMKEIVREEMERRRAKAEHKQRQRRGSDKKERKSAEMSTITELGE